MPVVIYGHYLFKFKLFCFVVGTHQYLVKQKKSLLKKYLFVAGMFENHQLSYRSLRNYPSAGADRPYGQPG